jgi:hypothetical protein
VEHCIQDPIDHVHRWRHGFHAGLKRYVGSALIFYYPFCPSKTPVLPSAVLCRIPRGKISASFPKGIPPLKLFYFEMFKVASITAVSAVMASSLRGVEVGKCAGTSYDFLELVTQWEPTLCSDGTFTCSLSNNWFTLHGRKSFQMFHFPF